MVLEGPLIIIEDDDDDQQFIKDAFIDLGYESQLKFFYDADSVISYLKSTTDKPFLIISDFNLSGMNGYELKKRINDDEQLRKKAIPFIFYTTSDQKYALDKVYEMMVQGFFVKENNMAGIKSTIKVIIDYWKLCKHPNSK
jgi:CheY-like chemotaxis protein